MDGIPKARAATFADDPDEDLLGFMAMRALDPVASREAGAEFYDRHKGFLFRLLKSRKIGKLIGGDQAVSDVVQQTFFMAYERASTYRTCGSTDRERQRRACRNWLVGIARNIIRDAFSRRISIVADEAFDDCVDVAVDVTVPPEKESEVVRLIEEELDAMSDREQTVLRTTMEYFKPGEAHQRLPNAVAAALAVQLGTTTQNVRAIRSRACRKIRDRVEAHLKRTQEGKR
jgi:RNA polymerase sigma factor (sigma-70 family)